MPNFKSHVTAGFFTFVIVYFIFFFNKLTAVTFLRRLIITIAGSVFPDIDTKSKGQVIFYFIIFLLLLSLLICKLYFASILFAFIAILPLFVKHRSIFHNLIFLTVFVVICSISLICFFPVYKIDIITDSLFFYVGIISHLLLDRKF